MEKAIIFGGWVVAIVAGFGFWYQYDQNSAIRAEVDALRAERDATQADIEQAEKAAEGYRLEAQDLRARVTNAETALEQAKTEQTAATADTSVTARAFERAAQRRGVRSGDSDAPEDVDTPNVLKLGGTEGIELTDEMVEQSAATGVNVQFGELFGLLNLDDERTAQVREALKRVLAEQVRATMNRMNKPENEITSEERDYNAWMHEELAQLLTPEELTVFDEYQAGEEERNRRRGYDMQLSMFAPGLSAEGRQMVLDTLVEESFLVEQEGLERSEAYPRAVDRLAGALPASEMSIVQGFAEQQQAALAAGANGERRQMIFLGSPGNVQVMRTETRERPSGSQKIAG